MVMVCPNIATNLKFCLPDAVPDDISAATTTVAVLSVFPDLTTGTCTFSLLLSEKTYAVSENPIVVTVKREFHVLE